MSRVTWEDIQYGLKYNRGHCGLARRCKLDFPQFWAWKVDKKWIKYSNPHTGMRIWVRTPPEMVKFIKTFDSIKRPSFDADAYKLKSVAGRMKMDKLFDRQYEQYMNKLRSMIGFEFDVFALTPDHERPMATGQAPVDQSKVGSKGPRKPYNDRRPAGVSA